MFEQIAAKPKWYQALRDFLRRMMARLRGDKMTYQLLNTERMLIKAYQEVKESKTIQKTEKNENRWSVDINSTSIEVKEPHNYPYNMQTVIKDYIDSVDSDILSFAKKCRNKEIADYERHGIGLTSKKLEDDISKFVKFNAKGYEICIDSTTVNHIEKRHGIKGKQDHCMSQLEDVARVGYVLKNYDSAEITYDADGNEEYSKQFRDKNNIPAKMLRLSKKIDGTYYTVIACPEAKWKKIWVVSAYIGNKKSSSVTQEPDANNTPGTTSKTRLASPETTNNSILTSEQNVKKKMFEIIQRENPADDEQHTWIRSADEIRTLEEAIADDEWDYEDYAPDYTRTDAEQAAESGEIEVFSSKPIKNGAFVTPSRMEAESYAGDGQVYSQTVSVRDVAWIDPLEGMMAKVEGRKYAVDIKTQESAKNQGAFVDKNGEKEYNKTQGDDRNYGSYSEEFRRVQKESIDLPERKQRLYQPGGLELDETLRRRLSGIFARQLDARRSGGADVNARITVHAKNGNSFTLISNVDPELFHDIFEISRKYLKYGELVDLHNIETTQRCFLEQTGKRQIP